MFSLTRSQGYSPIELHELRITLNDYNQISSEYRRIDHAFNKQVLVYAGEGTISTSIEHIKRVISSFFGSRWEMQMANEEYLLSDNWQHRTVMLIMGAGRAQVWEDCLKEEGIKKIHQFIRQGGLFIGIGCGAYFASKETAFSDRIEIKDRTKSSYLFSGSAVGPIFQVAEDPFSPSSAQATAIQLQDSSQFNEGNLCEGRVYVQGSCGFKDIENRTTEVIATYSEDVKPQGPGTPAIIKAQLGQGTIVLSGPSIEFAWDIELNSPEIRDLSAILKKEESFRKSIWKSIFRYLGL